MEIELKVFGDVVINGDVSDYDRQALIDLAQQIANRRMRLNSDGVKYKGTSWWENPPKIIHDNHCKKE